MVKHASSSWATIMESRTRSQSHFLMRTTAQGLPCRLQSSYRVGLADLQVSHTLARQGCASHRRCKSRYSIHQIATYQSGIVRIRRTGYCVPFPSGRALGQEDIGQDIS